jgi:dGTPase
VIDDSLQTEIDPPHLSSPVVVASLNAYGRDDGRLRLAHHDSSAVAGPAPLSLLYREQREIVLDQLLAPGATRPWGAGNRAREEAPDLLRTCFERDLDRIKYASPFRRLAGKCQVFLAPDDIHIRNRMTHTIEVAQVALSIAQAVGLNVSLTEAIAMGHDCGHGPGGHAAEDAFEPYVAGGYDHAIYGADVTLVPLNLCAETLDGIRSHSWRLPAPSTPEGEVVSISDRLAYLTHDAADAVRAGIIRPADLPPLVKERLGITQSSQLERMINSTIDVIAVTGRIGIDADIAEAVDAFRLFNYERIYTRPAARTQGKRMIGALRALVEHFADAPGLIPEVALGEWDAPTSGSPEAIAAAVHHVSSLTDRDAIASAAAIGVSPSDLPVVG